MACQVLSADLLAFPYSASRTRTAWCAPGISLAQEKPFKVLELGCLVEGQSQDAYREAHSDNTHSVCRASRRATCSIEVDD